MLLGFISDAHGNVEAFEQGLAVLRDAGATDLYFLGDAVGYLPGTGVIDAIRAGGLAAIQGNHDAMLLSGVVSKDRDRIYRHADTARTLSERDREFMAGWPIRRHVEAACGSLLLVHGSPAEPLHGYVYPDTDLAPFADCGARFVLMGQTHRPFVRQSGPTTFVNVGSCGLPRDCGNLGSVCLLDDETGDAEIVRFNIEAATAAALSRCGTVAPEVLSVFARREAVRCDGGSDA